MDNLVIRNKIYDILMSEEIIAEIKENMDFLLFYIPEINDMIGFLHKHPHHHLDVWDHTLYALSLSEKNFNVRLALLFHDIGKPHCFLEGDVRHFTNHHIESEKITRDILNRLEYEEEYINYICYLVYYHDIPISKKDIIENYDLSFERYLVQKCDALAHHPDKLEKRKKYINNIKNKLKEYR